MFEWLADPNAWIALATLTALEIVLGIDNIIFISILVSRVEASRRNLARRLGLSLAMLSRIALLLSLAWIMKLTAPLFTVLAQEISGRDIILIGGGLFLLWKSVHEIHNSLTAEQEAHHTESAARAAFGAVLVQIAIIDIVFSLDSVITAVGLVDQIGVMVAAILISVGVMMFAAKPIGEFVDANPTIKMLALSFLVLVGVTLIAEGFDTHVPKGYIYFAMAFSIVVELINIRLRKRGEQKLKLHKEMPGQIDA
ncbi:TerC family protein [Uliginosibacterium aquaticum]|uniref:TerC family protein n=1 Tax=Uliginosibacterium aquaticum TaxID=2731212 RepID=A0ABX2IG44_9RHOO|nr:TerC family protein [Uliginosibacterium aquaticum]NSL55207.1 TerC family protein [Uliginosibacterium aquaticum]